MSFKILFIAGWHANAGRLNKKGWKRLKKGFRPAFWCAQHPKAGQNTQQMEYGIKEDTFFCKTVSI